MNEEAAVAPELVEAELVVQPTPPALRFGLRTLMAITAVCSVQFAVMSYLGIFAGLIVGALFCLVVFTGVLLAGIALHHPAHAGNLRRLDRVVLWLMFAVVAIMLGTLLAGGGALLFELATRVREEAWLRTQIGLSVRQTQVVAESEARPALEVVLVLPGMPADAAGVRPGEYIVNFESTSDLLRVLQRNRGQAVDLELSADVSGMPGTIRKPRQVPLEVP